MGFLNFKDRWLDKITLKTSFEKNGVEWHIREMRHDAPLCFTMMLESDYGTMELRSPSALWELFSYWNIVQRD